MGDLSAKKAAAFTKLVGSDGTGAEQAPVSSTANGGLHSNLRDATGAEFGTASNPVQVSAVATALPSGASTAAKQDTGNASLSSIDTKLTSQATAAKQDTGNTSLSSIDTKLTSQATAAKQDTGNTSLSSIDTKLTSQATATKQDTGNTSLSSIDTKLSSQATAANQTTANASLSSIDGKLTSQATATKQDTGNTSLSSIDTKLSSQATATKQDTGNTSLSSIDTKLTSQATAANQATEITALQLIDNPVGSVAAGAAGTSSFLTGGIYNTTLPTLTNGQQAAAQADSRGRVIISPLGNNSVVKAQLQDDSGTAVTLGQKTMANSLPVVFSSDQGAIPVALPTGASTSANQATEITALQIIDDLPHAQNDTLVKGVPLMGQLDDTSTTAATEDKVAVARITAQRALHTNLRDSLGNEITSTVIGGARALDINTSNRKVTYSATILALATAASATDFITLLGSGTKTVRLIKIRVSGNVGGLGGQTAIINLIKRSTADSGGTSTAPTVVPHDSNDAAGTAVVRAYTANPTLGNLIGSIRAEHVFLPNTGTAATPMDWVFGEASGKQVVLRGTSEQICLNLNGLTLNSTVSISVFIEWTEE